MSLLYVLHGMIILLLDDWKKSDSIFKKTGPKPTWALTNGYILDHFFMLFVVTNITL